MCEVQRRYVPDTRSLYMRSLMYLSHYEIDISFCSGKALNAS
jgi:hypothetical protein